METGTRRTRQQTENMEREDMRQALEETLASLAELLCKLCVERVTWSRALAEDTDDKSNAEEIWKQYLVKRGDWIKPLGNLSLDRMIFNDKPILDDLIKRWISQRYTKTTNLLWNYVLNQEKMISIVKHAFMKDWNIT